MRSCGPAKVLLILPVCLTACQQVAPSQPVAAVAAVDYESFKACVDREAKGVADRHPNDWGYPINIENDILSICNPQSRKETINDNIYTADRYFSYVNTAAEAEMKRRILTKIEQESSERRRKDELNAPRLKAEKAEEADAGSRYFGCLVDHAKLLALNSSESAEVVARASFPSCLGEREAVFEVYRHHGHEFSPEAMEVADRKFYENLLLEIIKVRAPASPSPTPPSPPKSSGRDI